MTPSSNDPTPGWRPALALAWCAAALAYVAYAAYSYSGLYRWLAAREQAWFGAFDPELTFFALLVVLCLPALLSAPKRQRPATHVPAPPAPSQSVERTVWGIAAVALLVGLGAAGLAWRQDTHTPVITSITLAAGSEVPQAADQLIVTGRAQRSRIVVLAETTRGSTSQTAYTPLPPADWTARQPIRFLMREYLGSGSDTPASTGDGVVRFGPAAWFRNALPGVVRDRLTQGGLSLAPDAVLLDENVESAGYTLWIVAFFGCVMAVSLVTMRLLVARGQVARAVGKSHR